MRTSGTLVLTHSSRTTNLARSSVQFLTQRFGDPRRLDELPPFESLRPPPPLYSGAISFHALSFGDEAGLSCRPLGRIKSRDKIQHAALLRERRLLVGFEHRLERWRLGSMTRIRAADRTVEARFEHPLLAGLHTVEPLDERRALLSCSASDAVLVVDHQAGRVEQVIEMPTDLYGRGYELGTHTDLRRHYIPDGLQRTHLNAASTDRSGRRAAVSTLIQGAIGIFDLVSGEYRELIRGFVGCHGARFSRSGQVYFADSATGALVFLEHSGGVARRFTVDSRWLHDVQQIEGSIYAFALADSNELRIYDIDADRLLHRSRFPVWPVEGFFPVAHRWPPWVGNSTQALSYTPAGAA